ncbi:MAG: mandelate racemase/muconate lactonizing enzyme family protein [Acidobacteria bacterium]|nr:mandelate racemase/muconate lactonizing enzyme family protein [Acidobacteriota bacterium]MCI0721725.1 mandelate racemase/muconate lactonizing enzyme family protein [Acidobacteriota bacterium]
MKITDVQACVLKGFGEWVLVKINTDGDIHGIGEAYPSHSMGRGTKEVILGMKGLLVGEEPRDVERLTQKILRTNVFSGATSGVVVTAVSGVEIALWDIAGKAAGLPVYRLLGSKFRDRVRVYADVDPRSGTGNPRQSLVAAAKMAVDSGYDAIKIDLRSVRREAGTRWNRAISTAELREMIEDVRTVREAIGPDVGLAVDLHVLADVSSAHRLAAALEPFDLMWLEDPLPPENIEAMARIAAATRTPICTGESLYTAHEFRDLIQRQAADIVSPDIPKTGGLIEARKIAYLAELYYLLLAPHNTSSPVGTIASVHACATIPNFLALEYHGLWVPYWDDIIQHDAPLVQNGAIAVPERPGLGVELNRDVVQGQLLEGESLFD